MLKKKNKLFDVSIIQHSILTKILNILGLNINHPFMLWFQAYETSLVEMAYKIKK